ncbi:hypothetical protein OS493_006727 [Desmophyllum pertusum]|uniref:SWIM-type domain-containing protein n=1 Tax=Desmophyllum pertusum TaxID=174260 RepID=A0A9X0D4M7_9CNID|nr:hypothetical protein OS493_006727 [Desmophyllum pertusum]
MASQANSSSVAFKIAENDIPGASLAGRKPAELKNEELRFWLKCRGDPGKGLKTKAELVKRVEEYIETGRDQDIVDPDPNSLYTRRKEQHQSSSSVSSDSGQQRRVKFPESGWSTSLTNMPMFTRAEMNNHVTKSGKSISNQDHHSVPTGLRKAKTFLEDEYLHEIEATSDQRYFYFRAKCCHSFPGTVGFCNHVLALMLKSCKYTLYDCKSTKDLCQDQDQNPGVACTSELQKWHNKGGGKNIVSQPVMEVQVNKTRLDEARTRPGVRSLLYEARVNNVHDKEKEHLLKTKLKELSPNMGLAQMADDNVDENLVETKFGKCQVGSLLSYQVAFTESNFTATADINTVPRQQGVNCQEMNFPRFPLRNELDMDIPDNLTDAQKKVLDKLMIDEDKINEVEKATRQQAECDKWKDERCYRFTASRFNLIRKRKRNHDNFAQTLMHPKPFTSKYVDHGRKYEPVALLEYEKFMQSRKNSS